MIIPNNRKWCENATEKVLLARRVNHAKDSSCFKAYDVRGRVPGELNEDLAYRIGRAYAAFLSPARVAVGRDIRFSSLPLAEALTAGLNDAGVEVWDLGLCGTEQVYFATSHLGLDGGIMVTASHNPPEYNGMKFVREESRPLSGDSGLNEIERLAAAPDLPPCPRTAGGAERHGLPRRLYRPPVELHRPPGPETPQGGGERRQRLRRAGARRPGAAPALPVHQDLP